MGHRNRKNILRSCFSGGTAERFILSGTEGLSLYHSPTYGINLTSNLYITSQMAAFLSGTAKQVSSNLYFDMVQVVVILQ